jgi:hypothetical protein
MIGKDGADDEAFSHAASLVLDVDAGASSTPTNIVGTIRLRGGSTVKPAMTAFPSAM